MIARGLSLRPGPRGATKAALRAHNKGICDAHVDRLGRARGRRVLRLPHVPGQGHPGSGPAGRRSRRRSRPSRPRRRQRTRPSRRRARRRRPPVLPSRRPATRRTRPPSLVVGGVDLGAELKGMMEKVSTTLGGDHRQGLGRCGDGQPRRAQGQGRGHDRPGRPAPGRRQEAAGRPGQRRPAVAQGAGGQGRRRSRVPNRSSRRSTPCWPSSRPGPRRRPEPAIGQSPSGGPTNSVPNRWASSRQHRRIGLADGGGGGQCGKERLGLQRRGQDEQQPGGRGADIAERVRHAGRHDRGGTGGGPIAALAHHQLVLARPGSGRSRSADDARAAAGPCRAPWSPRASPAARRSRHRRPGYAPRCPRRAAARARHQPRRRTGSGTSSSHLQDRAQASRQ